MVKIYSRETMLRNTLKISQRNEGVSMQFFLLNMHEDIDFL